MDVGMDLDFPHDLWLYYQQICNRVADDEGRENIMEEHQRIRRVRRIISDRMNPFTAMEDEEFTARFRLQKHTMHSLTEEVKDELPVTYNRKG